MRYRLTYSLPQNMWDDIFLNADIKSIRYLDNKHVALATLHAELPILYVKGFERMKQQGIWLWNQCTGYNNAK